MLVNVHLILNDPPLQRRLRRALDGMNVLITSDSAKGEAEDQLRSTAAELVIMRETLLAGLPPSLPSLWADGRGPHVIVITDQLDPEHRLQLLGRGVSCVIGHDDPLLLWQPILREIVGRCAHSLRDRVSVKRSVRHGGLESIVANSAAFARLIEIARKVATQDASVLLLGETGVGKELFAQAIHAESPRKNGPFVVVNCAALPAALLESELFGHERGAFTDAIRDKRGKFELAHGGTIFLDELGDLPIELQGKILRVLQEHEIERLGGEVSIPIDARVIAATNVDLKAAMAERTFRADLYYRLSVVQLVVPPLRDRREDIEPLAQRAVVEFSQRFNKQPSRIGANALAALTRYDWPGNVRELLNVIERAVLLGAEAEIQTGDLPEELVPTVSASLVTSSDQTDPALLDLPIADARHLVLERFERWYLESQLKRTRGRVGEAARRMGIDPRSLFDKMRHHELDKMAFRHLDQPAEE